MKKSLFAFALVACVYAPATAQSPPANVRVGPAAEDSGAGTPPAGGKDARRAEAKKDAANDPKKVKGEKGNDQKSEPERAEKATPGNSVVPNSTTDAPAKSSGVPVVPIVSTKGTLTADTGKNSPIDGPTSAPGNGSTSNNTRSLANNLPPPAAPAPTSVYRVGIGDILDIQLRNVQARESTLFTVMAGGLIDYPLAGDPINIAGMTTEEVGVRLAAELRRRAVFEKPQVFVSVREYASHAVLVSGLVNEPGVKILRREAVPLYVIIAEAQPKPEASRAVVMSHATGTSVTVELSDPQALNMLVYPTDVVNLVARPQEFFYIGGEVGTPGQRDFHAGMTLTQALLASGGTTRTASGIVRVSRQNADGRLVPTTYNLRQIQEGSIPDPMLQPGDRIEVERKK